MGEHTGIFGEGAKVVISPDKMRAWVMLPPPAKGAAYTAAAIREWLPENGVVYGVDEEMLRAAAASGRYHELLEVARGNAVVPPEGGSYTLKIEKKPFTGLKGNPDGSLFYDDLSFLQEAEAGQVLAEATPPTPGQPGMTVTGETLAPPAAAEGKTLQGSGFEVTDGGRFYRAPSLSHVSVVNEQLVVTPLQKLPKLAPEDGPVAFEGNVLVEEDVLPSSSITASGSVFVAGRCGAAAIKAGRNVLLCGGMRAQGGFGKVEAKENVWGLCFEQVEIDAGGDICANHLSGCEAKAGGRASILGGRGAITNTQLYAKAGVVALQIGSERGDATAVTVGMGSDIIDRYETVEKKLSSLALEIQSQQQNISGFERVNRMKPDKGHGDAKYKEMVQKRDQALSVLNILNNERTRLKRSMDSFSNVSIVARGTAFPGTAITIDTRTMNVMQPLHKVKFKRSMEQVEFVTGSSGR